MKISRGYIPTAFEVREKETGEKLDCFIQEIELMGINDGKPCTRYNIGINGWTEWTCLYCIYTDEDFNNKLEVI